MSKSSSHMGNGQRFQASLPIRSGRFMQDLPLDWRKGTRKPDPGGEARTVPTPSHMICRWKSCHLHREDLRPMTLHDPGGRALGDMRHAGGPLSLFLITRIFILLLWLFLPPFVPHEFEQFFVHLSGNLQLSKATGVACPPARCLGATGHADAHQGERRTAMGFPSRFQASLWGHYKWTCHVIHPLVFA